MTTNVLESMQCCHILGNNSRVFLQSRNIIIRIIDGDDGGTKDLPFFETCFDIVRKILDLRQNQSLVAHTTRSNDATLRIDASDVNYHAIGAIVHIVARIVDGIDRVNEARCLLGHRMDVELQKSARILMNDIVERHIDEQVIVGLSILHPRLDTSNIFEERRCIGPNCVDGRHLHRRIEQMTWPGSFLRRIRSTMEVAMVDTCHHHQVEVGLTLAERSAEMLGKPSEGFGRNKLLAVEVCSRGWIFEHREVGIVATRKRIGSQTQDAEIGKTEALDFGNIDRGI